MADNQRMESSLASIDRLMQRLVILSEQDRQARGRGAPDQPRPQAAQNNTAPQISNTGANNDAVDASNSAQKVKNSFSQFASNVKDIDKLTKLLAGETDSSNSTLKQAVHSTLDSFNKFVDGSLQISSSSRQAFGQLSQISNTVFTNAARMESSAKQALAASKGEMSPAELRSTIASNVGGLIRNVTQYGYAVGGLLSAWDMLTQIIARERLKIELAARRGLEDSEAERGRKEAFAKATTLGKTQSELDLDALNIREQEIANNAKELNDLLNGTTSDVVSQLETYSSGFKGVRKFRKQADGSLIPYARTEEEEARIKVLQEQVDTDANEDSVRKRKDAIKNKKNAIKAEAAKTELLNKVAEVNNKLELDLLDIRLRGADTDYDAINERILSAKASLESMAKSSPKFDAARLSGIMDLTIKAQENSIAQATKKYEDDLNSLNANPITDNEGNTLKAAMLEEQKRILASYTEALKVQMASIADLQESTNADGTKSFSYNGSVVEITADQAAEFREKRTKANAPIKSALDRAEAAKIGLDRQDATALNSDALTSSNKNIRDVMAKAAAAAKISRKGFVGFNIDPTVDVEIKAKELETVIDAYKAEIASSTGETAATLTAELTKTELALKALKASDAVLADRTKSGLLSGIRTENIERSFEAAKSSLDIGAAKQANVSKQRARQMSASQGTIGEALAGVADVNEQRSQFAAAQELRDDRIKKYEDELSAAKALKLDEEKIVELQKKIYDLNAEKLKAMDEQAIVVENQAAAIKYQLNGDKSTFNRSRGADRIGNTAQDEADKSDGRIGNKVARDAANKGKLARREKDLSSDLGSESARFTKDFNESYRRRHGALTPEEKEQAKDERKMNNQLSRARRAIESGGGTRKQRELVAEYEKTKAAGKAEEPAAKIAKDMGQVLKHLAKMSGLKEEQTK